MFVSLNIIAVFLFVFFLFFVALFISILLIRDAREKQKAYSNFSDYLGEFQVVLSKNGTLLDAAPKYVSDPLFESICQEKNFKNILSEQEYARLQGYVKGLASYPDIPFIFRFETDQGTRWYELRAYIQKKSDDDNAVFLIKNVTLDVESRNQRDELELEKNMLLQNTGDFLWSIEVDSRRFTLLTPMLDDEGRVVPRSVGVQDLHALLSEKDYAIFEKRLNERIVEFRASGHDSEGTRGIRLRMYKADGTPCWYTFVGRLIVEEGEKMVFRGVARRMELLHENPVFEDGSDSSSLLSAAFALPDVRVVWMDRDYKVEGCNQAFSSAFNHETPDEVKGLRLYEVVGPRYYSFFERHLSEVFVRGKPYSWKGPFGVSDSMLWINAVPLSNLDGETNKILMVYMFLNAKSFAANKMTGDKK